MLRCLINLSCFPFLTNEELRLYILLLVNAADTEVSGRINLKQIERASGKMPAFFKIKSMMDSLKESGLAVMEGFIWYPANMDGEIRFRLNRPINMRLHKQRGQRYGNKKRVPSGRVKCRKR